MTSHEPREPEEPRQDSQEESADEPRQTRGDREPRGRDEPGCGGRTRRTHRHSRSHGRQHRKERVLHTRISEQLSDDIRRLADDLRVPVSNLVRNVLEEVFTAVETVSDDVGGFFEEILEEADGVRERIREQARRGLDEEPSGRRTRRRHRHSRRHRSGRSGARDVDVEEELRRDEEVESRTNAPDPERARADFSHVLGWQPVVVNRAMPCAGCGLALEPGDHAFMSIAGPGHSPEMVCADCTAQP